MAIPASKVKVEPVYMDGVEPSTTSAAFAAIIDSNQVPDLSSLGNIAELEVACGSGDAGSFTNSQRMSTHLTMTSEGAGQLIDSLQNNAKANSLGNNVQILTAGNNTIQNVHGAQIQTVKPQMMQSVVKKPITITPGNSGQTLTKVIFAKNPNNLGQQQQSFTNLSSTQTGGTQILVTTPSGTTQIASLSQPAQFIQSTTPLTFGSPTKSGGPGTQSLLLSPTKLVGGHQTTPTKQIMPANKVPISPIKTPTKIAVIPASNLSRSGQNIVLAKTMVTDAGSSGLSSSFLTTGKTATITMSPSKLTIRPQICKQVQPQVAKNTLAHQLNAGLRQPVPVGISGVQPVSVAGSKFQYVRLVTTTQAGSQSNLKPSTMSGLSTFAAKPIAPAGGLVASSQSAPMKITMSMPHTQHHMSGQSQRILLPATSQIAIRPAPSGPISIRPAVSAGTITQLPPGTTIISSGQNISGVQGFALVPAQYVTQLQQISQPVVGNNRHELSYNTSSSSNGTTLPPKHAPRAPATETGGPGQRPRKPCNCTKSQCLKLYCDCFANGEFCHNCNCNNCYNNLEHEEERSRAVKACLDRNPYAFHPKIGKEHGGGRKHNKGCNCKRSGCLKNYCECYEAKILCGSHCKCVGCKNFEESPERKTLMDLAQAADVRVQQQAAAKTKLSSQIDLPSRPPAPSTGERLPYTFITQEVIEATCNCLLAQAEEADRTRQMDYMQERMLLQEFGRCLAQIIESANKTRAPSPL